MVVRVIWMKFLSQLTYEIAGHLKYSVIKTSLCISLFKVIGFNFHVNDDILFSEPNLCLVYNIKQKQAVYQTVIKSAK
ncbi:hypothetical protein CFP56_029600 [Quercus suber]|uniref:Uncharacterized protein n=1 Tax=Quercus suber TaxID=58331 RepID=A0AAW0JR42_QUESU